MLNLMTLLWKFFLFKSWVKILGELLGKKRFGIIIFYNKFIYLIFILSYIILKKVYI